MPEKLVNLQGHRRTAARLYDIIELTADMDAGQYGDRAAMETEHISGAEANTGAAKSPRRATAESLAGQMARWLMRAAGLRRKTGLVLEGGGMRGLFTAGVLDVWMENGIRFDGIVGVSAGACFGCNFKSGQPGRVIRYSRRFAKDPRYCSWRSLISTGDMFNADFCYRELPESLDPFDRAAFERDPAEFHVVATDVATGEPRYRRIDRIDDEAFAWIRASASMPLVSRPVAIGDGRYMDGGLSDAIPLAYFESLGFERNVVVTTRPDGYRKKGHRTLALAKPFLRKTPAVYRALQSRPDMYNAELELVSRHATAGSALLLAPPAPLPVSRVCHDPDAMQLAYDIGRRTAEESLEAVGSFIA